MGSFDNNGGFASARMDDDARDLSDYQGLLVHYTTTQAADVKAINLQVRAIPTDWLRRISSTIIQCSLRRRSHHQTANVLHALRPFQGNERIHASRRNLTLYTKSDAQDGSTGVVSTWRIRRDSAKNRSGQRNPRLYTAIHLCDRMRRHDDRRVHHACKRRS